MGSGGSSAPRGGGHIAKRASSVPATAAATRPIKQAGKYFRKFGFEFDITWLNNSLCM